MMKIVSDASRKQAEIEREKMRHEAYSYNAGESRVDRWQNDFLNHDSILSNIESIPFFETRKYVKLIFRNMFFYKLLLHRDKSGSDQLNQIYDVYLGFKH